MSATAKLFMHGRSQAVHLPKEFRFEGTDIRPELARGERVFPNWRNEMIEPLPILMDNAIQIARDYLERTGELGHPEIASRFLLDTVESMVRRGERRRLLLSNKAIAACKHFRSEHKHLALIS
jgi:virulence-associated protein VagC